MTLHEDAPVRCTRPKIVLVTPVTPALGAPDSFGVRIFHLLDALTEVARVELFLWGGATIDADNPVRSWRDPRDFSVHRAMPLEQVPRIYEHSAFGRLRRSLQYTLARRPIGNRPRRAPAFEEHLQRCPPQLVCLYLPETAHLAFRVPSHIPVVSLLEEGLERRALMLAGSDPRRHRFAARTEVIRARRLYRRVSRRARLIAAISDEEAGWFRSVGVEADRLVVIPHGIDVGYFSALRDEGPQDLDIAVFGNMREPRNLTPAVAVLEEGRSRSEDWKWAFVGDIDPETQARLTNRGAIVSGYVSDVRPYYERTKVVLVPAQGDTGVKTTVLQAWAMKRPVVATPQATHGLPAVPNENVLVGADPSELIRHCESVIASADLQWRLAEAGHRAVTSKHDIGAISRRFADLCLSIITKSTTP
jgi:glycosyltransferase involved in cell wall biosynthesis